MRLGNNPFSTHPTPIVSMCCGVTFQEQRERKDVERCENVSSSLLYFPRSVSVTHSHPVPVTHSHPVPVTHTHSPSPWDRYISDLGISASSGPIQYSNPQHSQTVLIKPCSAPDNYPLLLSGKMRCTLQSAE